MLTQDVIHGFEIRHGPFQVVYQILIVFVGCLGNGGFYLSLGEPQCGFFFFTFVWIGDSGGVPGLLLLLETLGSHRAFGGYQGVTNGRK